MKLCSHVLTVVDQKSNKLCAATRLADRTHVVLQLLAIGEDGQEEVEIQKRLHERPISSAYRNRAVPLLQMITYEPERMVFGVFPLLAPGYKLPLHRKPAEGLEACYQWMEVRHRLCSVQHCSLWHAFLPVSRFALAA
jgi:hypothetical protein